jgi:hypothetical protein
MPEETISAADKAGCDCGPCLKKAGLAHNVRSMQMHTYNSRPRGGWRPRYTTDEAAGDETTLRSIPTFGIELETDVATSPRIVDLPNHPTAPSMYSYDTGTDEGLLAYEAARDAFRAARAEYLVRNEAHHARQRRRVVDQGNITADEAISLAGPRGFWHAKHDGSVSGPEFASQPASLAYWRSQKPRLTAMMKSLLHGGVRSHDGGSAGLHVNIGSDAFSGLVSEPLGSSTRWDSARLEWVPVAEGETVTRVRRNADHMFRFLTLVTVNPRWATRMAQRTHEQVQSWARFDRYDTSDARRLAASDWARNGQTGYDRYTVVNLSNEGRIEFRLPRGTLRVDRFFAKLEWVASMVEYTRSADNAPNVAAYTSWVQAHASEYPALVVFMRERFAARFENATVAA